MVTTACATYTNGAIAVTAFDTPTIVKEGAEVLDVASKEYQAAGDWVGVLFVIQAIGSVLWAIVLPMIKNRKVAYSLSLLLGAGGFISTYFIHFDVNIIEIKCCNIRALVL